MSPVAQAMVVNGIVLFAVLEADLGPHRKIGAFRLIRPLLLAAAIVPLYLTALATHGTDLALEVAGVAAGLLLGLITASLMRVFRQPDTGRPVSRAGFRYAAVWTIVIGARAAFSYGSYRWFSTSLGTWMERHQVDADAITNALVLMAVAMVVTRTLVMAVRSAASPRLQGSRDVDQSAGRARRLDVATSIATLRTTYRDDPAAETARRPTVIGTGLITLQSQPRRTVRVVLSTDDRPEGSTPR
jgi:hypothetical protein